MGYGSVYGEQLLQHGFQLIQMKRVCPIGLRLGRIVMNLEEDSIDSCRHCSACEHRDELRCPPLTPLPADGVWTECVPSKTTGAKPRMTGRERISTTRLLYPKLAPRSVSETRSLPLSRIFSTAWRMSQGATN